MKQHLMKRSGFSNGIRLKSEHLYKALIQDGLHISSRRRRLHICSHSSMRCGVPISNNMQQQEQQQQQQQQSSYRMSRSLHARCQTMADCEHVAVHLGAGVASK